MAKRSGMLRDIFRKNRKGIIFTYSVLVFENLLFALYPFLFGRAIDGMLGGDSSFFKFYVGIFAVGIIVGVARRMFDTRIFAKVWLNVSTSVIERMIDDDVDASKVITRGNLSARFVDFFEYNVPNGFRGGVSLVVSLVMLFNTVLAAMPWVSVFAATALIYSYYVANRRKEFDLQLQDTADDGNQAIHDKNKDGVFQAYDSRTKIYIKTSDWEARGWGVGDLLWLVSELVVVLNLVRMNASTGEILATVSYVGFTFRNIGTLAYFFTNIRAIEVAEEKIADCKKVS